jgi:hypothetical protein
MLKIEPDVQGRREGDEMKLAMQETIDHDVRKRREFFDRLFEEWPEVLGRPFLLRSEHGFDPMQVEEDPSNQGPSAADK